MHIGFELETRRWSARTCLSVNGVRTLFVEAGWPRTPRDGVVRGGGLACANIRHLGLAAANEELLLAKTNRGAPSWSGITKQSVRFVLHESDIRRHLAILLDTHHPPKR